MTEEPPVTPDMVARGYRHSAADAQREADAIARGDEFPLIPKWRNHPGPPSAEATLPEWALHMAKLCRFQAEIAGATVASEQARASWLREATRYDAVAAFTALPAPSAENRPSWRRALGITFTFNPSREDIDAAFREKAKTAHPDAGGSHEEMAALTEARTMALASLGGA